MSDYLMIGEVLKPQGIHGECKIRSWAADTALFSEWKTLFLRQQEAYVPVPFHLRRIQDNFVFGVLGSCVTVADAEKYRGRELYIDRVHAAPLEEGAVYIADLIGCEAGGKGVDTPETAATIATGTLGIFHGMKS